MKFFWKIFFSIMLISITCFSIGGYLLVYTNFDSMLKSEAKIASDFGDIVYHSLSTELQDIQKKQVWDSTDTDVLHAISTMAESVNINNTNEKITFCITSDRIGILFSSLKNNFDKDILNHLGENQRGYTLKKQEDGIYIQAIRPATILGEECHIETIRDVSYIFENQKKTVF